MDPKEDFNDLSKKVDELTHANNVLKANISTLYRTAKAEIARKNERILELQNELDNLIFKRMDKKNNLSKNQLE